MYMNLTSTLISPPLSGLSGCPVRSTEQLSLFHASTSHLHGASWEGPHRSVFG